MNQSNLEFIPGIGPNRIKKLLNHFQSIEAIQMATIDQLNKVPGFGPKKALNIWEYFHNESDSNEFEWLQSIESINILAKYRLSNVIFMPIIGYLCRINLLLIIYTNFYSKLSILVY